MKAYDIRNDTRQLMGLMSEDEMYDVNGGGWFNWKSALAATLVSGIIATIATFRWETAFAQAMAAKAIHSVSFLVYSGIRAALIALGTNVLIQFGKYLLDLIW